MLSLIAGALSPTLGKDAIHVLGLSTLLLAFMAAPGARGDPSISEALSQSYAPVNVKCPKDVRWFRPAVGLDPREADWVQGRKPVVLDALASYLDRLGMQDFDVSKYICSIREREYAHVPIIGMAVSGGGWASAFTGTGAIRALDDRLDASKEQRTGGLLQSLTYLSGLSGGALATLSFALYDFPTADQIVDLWYPEINRLTATEDTAHAASPETIVDQLGEKAKAGFNISIADYLGRTWGYEFVPGAQGGLATLTSDIVSSSKFKSHQMPFSIVQFLEIDDNDVEYFGLKIPFSNATIVSCTILICLVCH